MLNYPPNITYRRSTSTSTQARTKPRGLFLCAIAVRHIRALHAAMVQSSAQAWIDDLPFAPRRQGPGDVPVERREEIMRDIIRSLAHGLSLPRALRAAEESGLPAVDIWTVYGWRERYPAFRAAYDLARSYAAHSHLDRALAELDEAKTKESAFAARVKAEGLIKLAEKWNPERFGPRVTNNASLSISLQTNLEGPGPAPQIERDGAYVLDVQAVAEETCPPQAEALPGK